VEALYAAKSIAPDVILMHIGMPGMSGYDVCRALRRDPAFANTVIIAQTGWGQEKDRQEARAAGVDHHIVKPIAYDTFSNLLSGVTPAVA